MTSDEIKKIINAYEYCMLEHNFCSKECPHFYNCLGGENIVSKTMCALRKYKDEVEYREFIMRHKVNGSLDGTIVMSAFEVLEHRAKESDEKLMTDLRKLANNPALSDTAKETIRMAIAKIRLLRHYRDHLIKPEAKHHA